MEEDETDMADTADSQAGEDGEFKMVLIVNGCKLQGRSIMVMGVVVSRTLGGQLN